MKLLFFWEHCSIRLCGWERLQRVVEQPLEQLVERFAFGWRQRLERLREHLVGDVRSTFAKILAPGGEAVTHCAPGARHTLDQAAGDHPAGQRSESLV